MAHTAAGFRTYRVSRIISATALELASERPADFDLAAHWQSSTDQFRESRRRFVATLRLDPQAADHVRAWRMADPPVDETAPDEGNWVTLRVYFQDEEQARFVALGFGPRAEVVAPASLQALVEADLAAMVRRSRSSM